MDEHTTPTERPDDDGLSAEQSADVIRHYNDIANAEYREKGWKDKVPMGKSAIHTTMPSKSILPDGSPALTPQEMRDGLKHIENPPKSDEYYRKLDEIVQKGPHTYDDARRLLDNDGMK